MDLIGFVGVIFLGLHGISWGIMGYIYILSILFGMLGGILGLFMEKHVLEASPTGD
jgi:hypothetical protein